MTHDPLTLKVAGATIGSIVLTAGGVVWAFATDAVETGSRFVDLGVPTGVGGVAVWVLYRLFTALLEGELVQRDPAEANEQLAKMNEQLGEVIEKQTALVEQGHRREETLVSLLTERARPAID